jgi:hypothetical protein
VEWEKLGRELSALQHKIHERVAAKPVNPVNEFLKQLVRKN